MTLTHRLTGCLLAATLAACAGCGGRLQPAGGKVLVDGVPVNEGRPATARIMEDGSFTLSFEQPGDGLPVGEYKVVIVADHFEPGKKTKQQEYDEANLKKQGILDTSTLTGGTLVHIVPEE